MTASMLLVLGVVSALSTVNTRRPIRSPSLIAVVSFFAGWLTSELALHQVTVQMGLALLLVVDGGLSTWPGLLGLALTSLSSLVLVFDHIRASRAFHAVDSALIASLGEHFRDELAPSVAAWLDVDLRWGWLVFPFPVSHPDVERIGNVVYQEHEGGSLRLDIIRGRKRKTGCPTLLYVHGGGWVIGHRKSQGLPLMQHLASLGWVCFSVDYRLSPRATFPDHLVDVKRAIAWVRGHASEYGADPDFLVLSGNSAGGHLAALAALTANRPEYQPGFEQADTSVSACVPFYGIYDFTDRHNHFPNPGLARLLERHVMKARLLDARGAYEKASPIEWVHEDAPPFFLIHGNRDTLVPTAEARCFFAALAKKSRAPVAYAEIEGAQHAFEIFRSRRAAHVIRGVTAFLSYVYSQRLAERAAKGGATSAADALESSGPRSSGPRSTTKAVQA